MGLLVPLQPLVRFVVLVAGVAVALEQTQAVAMAPQVVVYTALQELDGNQQEGLVLQQYLWQREMLVVVSLLVVLSILLLALEQLVWL